MSPKPGSIAPDFTASTDGGSTLSLSDFRGRNVVLYFYPKDNTSGCTKEACDFRDSMERLTSQNAVVIGVSPDSIQSHDTFKSKYDLPFVLVSDTTKAIAQQYSVWVEKSMYGRKYMGVERSTFVIDAKGIVRAAFHKVKVPGHVDQVIHVLQSLV